MFIAYEEGVFLTMELEQVVHDFDPIFNKESRVLMLGTMPSPKSREDKIALALRNHIAVWDVLAGCEIRGADDSSIRNPVANDMSRILDAADIKAIFTTGTKAAQLYKRYCYPKTGIEAAVLPSTSPANCRISYEELYRAYEKIAGFI